MVISVASFFCFKFCVNEYSRSSKIFYNISLQLINKKVGKELSFEYNWYAVYTRSRTEKKVLQLLLSKGIESYVPILKRFKQWSDRKKWVEEPAIRSYIFVRISNIEYYDVLNTAGVVRYVYFEKSPAIIPDRQIEIMRKVVDGNIKFEASKTEFKKGDKIIITSGILNGIEGELIRVEDEGKILIRIVQVGYSLLLNLQEMTYQKG
jgi:transcriptional antiterminator RfaH